MSSGTNSESKPYHKHSFSPIEQILLVATFLIVAVVGWRFFQANELSSNQHAVDEMQIEPAPQINTREDLDTAKEYLNPAEVNRHLDIDNLDEVLIN